MSKWSRATPSPTEKRVVTGPGTARSPTASAQTPETSRAAFPLLLRFQISPLQIFAEFVTSAVGVRDFPGDRLPELALVGRSNVGKSSLINALVRQKVARTSGAPGKTRQANFYRVQRGKAPPFYFVDLPGYGYARASRQAGGSGSRADRRSAAASEFDALAHAYFARMTSDDRGAPPAAAVIMLVDARHPALEADLAARAWLRTLPIAVAVVGTKSDKLTRAERVTHQRLFDSAFEEPVLLVSAQTGEGLNDLWTLIARLPSRPSPSHPLI